MGNLNGALVRTSAPSQMVTTAEFKTHVHEDLNDSTNNTYIDSLIVAATDWAEIFTARSFVTQTWTWYLKKIDTTSLYLPRPQIQSITSISYVDTAGSTQTWSSSEYDWSNYSGELKPAPAYSWPPYREQIDAITLVYIAGYGNSTTVPEPIKLAVKMLASHWYEHRASVSETKMEEVPQSVKMLLWSYRFKDFV